VVLLELPDICSLRATSRSLAVNATQNHFKWFLRNRRLLLRETSLAAFAGATYAGRLGCLVERLELVGMACDAGFLGSEQASDQAARPHFTRYKENITAADLRRQSHQLRNSRKDVRLLSEAFRNLKRENAHGCLQELSLRVSILPHQSDAHELQALPSQEWELSEDAAFDEGLDLVSCAAAETLAVAASALNASRLPVHSLSIFDRFGEHHCALPSGELEDINLIYPGLCWSLTSLRSLSLTLSRWKHDNGDELVGFSRLLQLTPNLRTLDVHVYVADRTLNMKHEYHMYRLATLRTLPKLDACCLRGLYVDVADLKVFIEQSSPRTLRLEHMIAQAGQWDSFFTFIASMQSSVEDLNLDDLFEQQQQLHLIFDAPGALKYGAGNGTHTLRRQGIDLRSPITYHVNRSRLMSKPGRWRWVDRSRREYGR